MSDNVLHESWLQRNWRPLSMLIFVVLMALDAAGILPNRLSDRAWDVMELVIGGYVLGRSAEKIARRFGGMTGKT